ncbi:MAG: hypothetical protein J6Y02_00945 [Pseudobutyrivibrio sp.]|nr:hypothetical protein [Pseudobutyrivibrio sp.]
MTEKILKNVEIERILMDLDRPDSIKNTTDSDKKLPIRILWKIETNYKALKEIGDRIVEKRDVINKDYSSDEKSMEDTDQEGVPVRRVKPEFIEDWRSELNDLLGVENAVTVDPILLEDIESLDMVPGDFSSISFMVEEG